MFPCQPSCEVPGGWLLRMEVTVSPCSTVLGATGVTLPCHSALLRFPAGLPYFPLATIHCPSPLLAIYDLPPTVTPGEQPSPWGGGQGQMLVVAAGEQDVLPAWGLLLASHGVLVINEQVPQERSYPSSGYRNPQTEAPGDSPFSSTSPHTVFILHQRAGAVKDLSVLASCSSPAWLPRLQGLAPSLGKSLGLHTHWLLCLLGPATGQYCSQSRESKLHFQCHVQFP